MKVVIDTNVLLVSIPKQSPYRVIFDHLIAKKYDLLISNEVLHEYTEIIARKANPVVANNIAEMLLTLSNVHKHEVYYKWQLIDADKDDNKFVDCAIAGNADFLVSNDRHFNVLKTIEFPKLQVLTISEFIGHL